MKQENKNLSQTFKNFINHVSFKDTYISKEEKLSFLILTTKQIDRHINFYYKKQKFVREIKLSTIIE